MPRTNATQQQQLQQLVAFLRVYGGGPDRDGQVWDDEARAALAPGGSILVFRHDPRRSTDASFCAPVVARLAHLSQHLAQHIQPALRRLTPKQQLVVRTEYLAGRPGTQKEKASGLGSNPDAYRKCLDAALVHLVRLLWDEDANPRVVE